MHYNLYNIIDSNGQFYVGSSVRIVMSVLIAYYFLKISATNNVFFFCLFVSLFSIFWVIQIPVFSPIDEGAHFSYINFICENNKLPLVTDIMDGNILSKIAEEAIPSGIMYEAVHPPVYYILTAFLCGLFDSVVIRFWICRILGSIILVVIAGVIFSWCRYLNQIGLIDDNKKQKLLLCAILVLCMPGVLTRFGTVSNEGLAVLFVTLILYELTKVVFDGLDEKKFLFINLLILLAFLTKITTAFVIVLWILVLLYYKKYRMGVISSAMIGVGILPWILFNYVNYGSITATKFHLSYVLPIVNPNKESLDIISGIANIFYYFFYPQEGIVSEVTKPIIYFLNLFMLIIFLIILSRTIRNIWKIIVCEKYYLKYSLEEKKDIIEIIYSFCVFGNITILILGSISSYVSIMIGRYLYLSFIPIIYLIFSYIEEMKQKKFYRIMVVFSCILCLENTLTYLSPRLSNIVGSMCDYESIDINNIASYDVTVENGIVISGIVDPQITFLDELKEKYRVVEFELEVINNSMDAFVMYYAVDGYFTEENKIVSYYDVKNKKIRFIFKEGKKFTNVRLDPPAESSIVIKKVKVFK